MLTRLAILLLTPFLFAKTTRLVIGRVVNLHKVSTAYILAYFEDSTFLVILPVILTVLLGENPFIFLGLRVSNQLWFDISIGLTMGAIITLILLPTLKKPSLGLTLLPNEYLWEMTPLFIYPFMEEIFWRGFFQSNLIIFLTYPLSILITAFVFGFYHLTRFNIGRQAIPRRIVAGLILGLLFFYTGNLIAPTVAHYFNSLTVFLSYRLLGRIRVYQHPPRLSRQLEDCNKNLLRVQEFTWKGEKFVLLENSRIFTAINPRYGGRIVFLYDKLLKQTLTYSGCLHDVFEFDWPGFDKTSYMYTLIKNEENQKAVLLEYLVTEGRFKGLKITKKLTLEREQSALKVDYTLENNGDEEKTITFRVRNAFLIGETWRLAEKQFAVIPTLSEIIIKSNVLYHTTFLKGSDLPQGTAAVWDIDNMSQAGLVWRPKDVMALLLLCDVYSFSFELIFKEFKLNAKERTPPLTFLLYSSAGPDYLASPPLLGNSKARAQLKSKKI